MHIIRLPLIAIVAGIFLGACAVLETASNYELGTRIAVAEIIGGDAATADRVIEVAHRAEARLDGDPSVSIERLRAEAEQMIPWGDMSPGQRILALEVLARVEDRLRDEVEAGSIPPDALANLREILATVIDAAKRERALAS